MPQIRKIAVGCDHAGYEYKQQIKQILSDNGKIITDHGTFSADSTDYPDFAHPVADEVEQGDVDTGILICGSGNGVCMTANKHSGIRAALCWNNELAELARKHNDANIICIPARFVSIDTALEMVETFLNTEFEGGRHGRRVQKISKQ